MTPHTSLTRRVTAVAGVCLWSLALVTRVDAQTPIQIGSPTAASGMTFGLLAQATAQSDVSDGQSSMYDLGLRRFRMISSGHVGRHLKLFVESDTPYLGQHNTVWSVPPTILQDLIVTYEWNSAFQLDAGLLLVPVSYNATQSAASLLAVGYGPYSFVASAPTHSRTGRDQGIQARGYIYGKRLEYRAGVFRGARKADEAMPPRSTVRLAWHAFGAPTGFFYPGTAFGRRKSLAVGISLDQQGAYRARGADLYSEWPLPRGGAATVQVDYTRYNGGGLPGLADQHNWLVEGGVLLPGRPYGLFGQVAHQDLLATGLRDAASTQVGFMYWAKGHRLNLKIGAGRGGKAGAPAHVTLVTQCQVFVL